MELSNSLFAKYYLEREGMYTIEEEYGFVTYKLGPDYVYIVDIYVLPDIRQKGLAASLADKVVEQAIRAGKTKAIGTIDLEAEGKTQSAKALLGYGFELDSSDGKMIYFVKELPNG